MPAAASVSSAVDDPPLRRHARSARHGSGSASRVSASSHRSASRGPSTARTASSDRRRRVSAARRQRGEAPGRSPPGPAAPGTRHAAARTVTGAGTGTNTDAHGLPRATQARPAALRPARVGGQLGHHRRRRGLEVADVHAHASPRCRRLRPRSGAATTGPSRPGAPHGPVPWSRRCATTARAAADAAARGPVGRDRRRTKARLAARRPSANPVGVAGSRQVSRSVPGRRPGDGPGPVAAQREPVGDGAAALDRAAPPTPGPRSRAPTPRWGRR